MSMTLQDQHFIVTGAARGIGEAIARALAAQGARLSLMGRDRAALDVLAKALPASQVIPCDVTREDNVRDAVADAVAQGGPVQGLINNAGAATSAPIEQMRRSDLQQMLDVNLIGPFLMMQAVLPAMRAAGYGRIVTIASTASLEGYAYAAAYAAAKHGVLGLVRSVAEEIDGSGVTINAVCPGFTETALLQGVIDNIIKKTGKPEDQVRAELAGQNAVGRILTPAEVAAVVLRLCQVNAGQMNGAALSVPDGERLG